MALKGDAAVAGVAEHAPQRRFTGTPAFTVEQWADLAAAALADAELDHDAVDGIVCSTDVYEATHLIPSVIAEYCGWDLSFAERVDLGGASAVGMVWRAALAIEAGVCNTVVCALPALPRPPLPEGVSDVTSSYARSDGLWGSLVERYEKPYKNLGPNVAYALVTSAYDHAVPQALAARARVVEHQRLSAAVTPEAVHLGKPVSAEDVLASKVVVPPLHLLEIVMPCAGGAAVVVTRADNDRSGRTPVRVTGFGESTSFNTPTYTRDWLSMPLRTAAHRAFEMAAVTCGDIDQAQLYDAYSIMVLLSLESAGFCPRGGAARFVLEHDLSYRGDFPCNTNGGQLGMGQAANAGGMTHVIEAVRQLQGRAGDRQLSRSRRAFVSGSGGSMAVQAALILEAT